MAPEIKVRKTIVCPDDDSDGFMTMDEQGNIAVHRTPEAVVQAVKTRDAAAARRGTSTATLIEWRDMPDGFVPPALPAP